MLLTLPQIKQQCRLDLEFDFEDDYLMLLAEASEKKMVIYLNRNLYSNDVPLTDQDGLTVSSDIKLAMLQMISHWYENRSSVTDFEQSEVPMSFFFLASPYRIIPV